jgi:gluconate 2-dehydrogenase gamma chain
MPGHHDRRSSRHSIAASYAEQGEDAQQLNDEHGSGATYPSGTVRRLLQSDLVTPRTREVLESRIAAYEEGGGTGSRFFNAEEFRTLKAVCDRLIPQPDHEHPVDLAGTIDQRLADGKTNGWRYDDMPADGAAYREAMRGLDETARAMFRGAIGANGATRFDSLTAPRQDAVLAAVQSGAARGAAWKTMSAPRFFEELLAEATECYYSHPVGADEIGFAGFADAHGWQRIGLNQLEPFEPRALGDVRE